VSARLSCFAIVAESNIFVCTFEDDSCPLYDSSDSDEKWIKVNGWLSATKDNTLNRGTKLRTRRVLMSVIKQKSIRYKISKKYKNILCICVFLLPNRFAYL